MATPVGDYEKRYHAHGIILPRRSVAASDDTWRIDMNCTFPGLTATRYCSCLFITSARRYCDRASLFVGWLVCL